MLDAHNYIVDFIGVSEVKPLSSGWHVHGAKSEVMVYMSQKSWYVIPIP